LAQFAGRFSISVTNQATFISKAKLFPHSTFIVGFDTAERLLKKQYYNNSDEEMLTALHELKSTYSCDFLVSGRVVSGKYCTLMDLSIPHQFKDIFICWNLDVIYLQHK